MSKATQFLVKIVLKPWGYSSRNGGFNPQLVKNPPAVQEPWFNSWLRKILWRRDRLTTPVFLGFPCGSAGKKSARNVGGLGSIPGLGRSPGEGKGYSCQ